MKYLKTYHINEEYNSNAEYEYQWKNKILTAIYKDSRYDKDIKIIKDLVIIKKVNINFIENDYQNSSYTPLILAIKLIDDSHIYIWSNKITMFLINNGADVNFANKYGKTPIIQAVIINQIHIIKKLLEKGAKINHQDNEGNTALLYSLKSRHGVALDIVVELINAGADLFIKNNDGEYSYKLMIDKLSNSALSYIFKSCPEQYEKAKMIITSQKYNI